MKIVKVEAAWITRPCNPPQGVSSGDITRSTDAICRLTTDTGHDTPLTGPPCNRGRRL